MSWDFIVSSKQVVEGSYAGEALRLRSFLDVVSDCMPPVYSEPIVWRGEDLTAEQWNDLAEVAGKIERRRRRNEDGSLPPGSDSSGVVLACRNDAAEPMIGNLWNVGGDDEWQFNSVLTFYADDITTGDGLPLERLPVEWLVKLMSRACASVDAAESRIETTPLAIELIQVRRDSAVGELTLAPNGIGDAKLPASITAYPCIEGYPNGLVLVADLERAANDPASLVDDLLAVDDIIRKDNDDAVGT